MQSHAYQTAARRTAKSLPTREAYDHMAMGLASDFGELITLVKAHVVYNKPLDTFKVKEEAGDCCWFLSYGCDLVGAQFDQMVWHYISDPVYMASHHMGDGYEYWAKVGAVATGEVNALVLRGIAGPDSKSTLLYLLAKLYVCVVQICFKADLLMGDVLVFNTDKLKRRYPEKYTDEAAQARADKQ